MGASLQSSGRKSRNKRADYRLMSEINVTPFVDVMLVLLVIFMITSPMMVAGVNVDLPDASATPVTGQEEPLAITVDGKGNVYIQETQIELQDVVPKLKAMAGENRNMRIFVRGDKGIHYGKVMEVVSAIHTAGFNRVALLTDVATN